jgi:hypothetical protein
MTVQAIQFQSAANETIKVCTFAAPESGNLSRSALIH